jgi:flavin reductase (DIM6/NTAB) family NADH-FMN oxidoreductase RutF
MSIDEKQFRQTMSQFASGVTVVTTQLDGVRHGLTVSAFASLSLRPPLVLISIEKTVRTHDALSSAGMFGVSILSSAQEEISSRFASRIDDRFAGVSTSTGELGVPLIEGAIAWIECRITDRLPGGDHTIFVGEVVSAQIHDGEPLLYFRSGYRRVAGG